MTESKMMKRRKALKIMGASLAVTGAATYIWAAPTAKPARAPWRNAGQYDDPVRFALSYAVLAPNPHNRQPWQVKLVSKTEAVLYCDPARRLPVTDPLDRQITIGLGCFLETLNIAANERGYRGVFNLFPDGAHPDRLDERPVARIKLIPTSLPGNQNDETLFSSITRRRTDRSPFSGRALSDDDIEALNKAAGPLCHGSLAQDILQNIRTICVDATKIEFLTPQTYAESVDLMRVGRNAINQNPDGISLEGPMIEVLNAGGVLTPDALKDTASPGFKQGLNMYLKAVNTARGFIWITTPDNSREAQIAAGRAYVRANLKATQLGISVQPLSQCLQEYPEMEKLLVDIHALLGVTAPARIQMLARLGYGTAKNKSPRWPLNSRLINT